MLTLTISSFDKNATVKQILANLLQGSHAMCDWKTSIPPHNIRVYRAHSPSCSFWEKNLEMQVHQIIVEINKNLDSNKVLSWKLSPNFTT